MIKSPCQKRCRLNDEGYCIVCKRSEWEIMNWSKMSEEAKEEVLINCEVRKSDGLTNLN